MQVVLRAAGAVHNLSSEVEAIQVIRRYGGLILLADLLNNSNEQVGRWRAGGGWLGGQCMWGGGELVRRQLPCALPRPPIAPTCCTCVC